MRFYRVAQYYSETRENGKGAGLVVPLGRSMAGRCQRFPCPSSPSVSSSMRQRLDVPGLYADALKALPETIDGQPPSPAPEVCPVTLDELLADDGPASFW
jgi:hypothetical protein